MNIYHAFYKGQKKEITAETSLKAQTLAAQLWKAKKSWEVTVVIVSKEEDEIVHVADF